MKTSVVIAGLLLALVSFSFRPPDMVESVGDPYWVLYYDDSLQQSGYLNTNGDTMIPAGKYLLCQTDTFRSYAKVLLQKKGWVAIDKAENVLYEIHTMDNGPDYPEEGLFRIWKNGKMGYADERTGKIILYPQFSCGFPFEKGVAKVSLTACVSKPVDKYGEYHYWETDEWIYIDHTGKQVAAPK